MTTTAKPSILERLRRLAPHLMKFATPQEAAQIDADLAEIDGADELEAKAAPTDPIEWLRVMFPAHFSRPFAPFHIDFWRKVWSVQLHDKPQADVEIWPRGTGKTTNCEAAATMVGVRGRRRYILYVRRTQARADDSVANIARLLESPQIAAHYPKHGQRFIGKFGKPGEWRRNRLRTAGGLTIDAIGLDTAARGVKMDDQRPDMIIFDDIDEPLDSPKVTAKKLTIIKSSVIPAGSSNRWIVGVQNLIKRDSVFSQLADGSADFLTDAKVSPPIPAIRGLKWQWGKHPKTGRKCGIITAGTATWEGGKNLEACQQEIYDIGIMTFLKECQHDVMTRSAGIALRFDPRHVLSFDRPEQKEKFIRELIAMGRVFGGVDFGFWRFGFTLWAVDRKGVVYRLDEFFAQNLEGEWSFADRAQGIHYLCEAYGLGLDKTIPIWGDAANPTDIAEINKVLKNGWQDEDGRICKSKLRVVAVGQGNKQRKTSVDRLNRLLDEDRFFIIAHDPYEWRHGQTVDNPEGTPLEGSRLVWEIDHWSFPTPKPGEEQEQDPDDSTADGADMVASMRYAIMSFWEAAKALMEFGTIDDDRAEHFDVAKRRFMPAPHAVDQLTESRGRRTVAVRAPRPRFGKR